MRISWMVIPVFLWLILAGCGVNDPLKNFGQEAPMAGCMHMNHADERAYLSSAEKYFLEEVGVKVDSHKIGRPSACKEVIIVPIAAVTEYSNVPKIWFVEIGRKDNIFRLDRPD